MRRRRLAESKTPALGRAGSPHLILPLKRGKSIIAPQVAARLTKVSRSDGTREVGEVDRIVCRAQRAGLRPPRQPARISKLHHAGDKDVAKCSVIGIEISIDDLL
jgi:hypothetical protein